MSRVLVALVAATLFQTVARGAELSHFADAPLRAVQFVDETEGWAVGDDGVILHTIDGGQTWERQPTGVRASLRAVCFLDPFTGFVVGREGLPYRPGSAGVVLFTNDGGTKWQRISLKELPGLHAIKFLDQRTGFLAGEATDQYPTGLFFTQDGGVTWKPVEGARGPGWLAADFADRQTGAVVGPWGHIALLRRGELLKTTIEGEMKNQKVRAVQIVDGKPIAVGDGGRILTLQQPIKGAPVMAPVDLKLPVEVQRCWDFHALHFAGEHGWVVGRPGSAILHTWDGGKSWQVQNTGQSLPLRGVFFLNAKQGWVVGELGTILATTDGGKTWKVQRRGGHRAAVLVVTARGETLPAGTVAALGGDEGYLCGAVRLTCSDPVSAGPPQASESARFAEAVRRAGGCGGEVLWQFRLPQHLLQADAKELAMFWGDSADPEKGIEELQRQLVLALRTWQPSVILTDHPDPRSETGQLGAALALAMSKAFDLAGKADAFPDQIGKLGLQPWSVSKLYGRWDAAEGAHLILDLGKPRPLLLGSPLDYAGSCLSLLFDDPPTPARQAYYRLLASRAEKAESHKHPCQGLTLNAGGQARRERDPFEVDEQKWGEYVRVLQQRRDYLEIAKQSMDESSKARQMLAAVEKSLAGLPEEQAGEAAFALANLYARTGQWPMAKEVFLLLVDRYPAHRLAPEACRWLIRHGSSSEARRREELGQFFVTQVYEFSSKSGKEREAPNLKIAGGAQLRGGRETVLLRRQDDIREWHKSSLAVGEHLDSYGPLYAADPEIQFCLQAANRRLGEFDKAHLWYTQFKTRQGGGPWHNAAASELWLNRRNGLPPKPVAQADLAETPPYLDGKLDDECWKEVKPIVLQNAVGKTAEQFVTEAWITYDAHHLYLALRCKHPGNHFVPPVKPRKRDDDLRRFDRVSFMLDLDRDYSTYFHFQVDQRGCVGEDCWGDRSWNPKWFVAVHSEERFWQIEAAIPLAELTGDRIRPGEAWACNLVRTIPGQGVQAFSIPADVMPRPEGMGLLMFHRPDSPKPSTVPVTPRMDKVPDGK